MLTGAASWLRSRLLPAPLLLALLLPVLPPSAPPAPRREATAAAALAAPRVVFNHAYFYVDSATYASLRTSAFVRDSFAVVREATVSDGGHSWSALYLFGRRSYLEVYRAGAGTPPAGTVAIAFGVDRFAELDAVEVGLRSRRGASVRRFARRRVQDTIDIPWFDQVELDSSGTPAPGTLRWWVMAYDTAHLALRYPADAALRGRTDRASYLARLHDPRVPVRDVNGLAIAMDRRAIVQLADDWRAMGLRVAQDGGGAATVIVDDLTIRLDPTPAGVPSGLQSVSVSLAPGALAVGPRMGGAFVLTVDSDSSASITRDDRCAHGPSQVIVPAASLATCRNGAGATLVVFESGLGEGIEAWQAIQDSVGRFARTLSYDRVGIGASPMAAGIGDARATADRLAALLDAIGERQPVVVVAHSLGGATAQVFAQRHPTRVRALVLVDPTPAGFFAAQRRIMGEGRYAATQRRLRAGLAGASLAEWLAMDAALIAADSARSLGVPVRILSAGRIENPDSTIGRPAKAEWLRLHAQMASRLGGRQLTIRDSGHRMQASRPDAIVGAVREVLSP